MAERGAGFQKPKRAKKTREVRLAVISYEDIWALCSCGWAFGAKRDKVREDAVDRHLERKHNGRGIRT